MESVGAFPEGEWDSISRMLNADQGFDYAPQLFGQYPFSHEHDDSYVISSTFCSPLEADASMGGVTESSFYSLEGLNSTFQYIFQESSLGSGCSSTSVSVPGSSRECYYFSDGNVPMTNNTYTSNDIYMTDENSSSFALSFPDTSMDESARANECDGQLPAMAIPAKEWPLKRKFDVPDLNTEGNTNSENPKKKPRVSRAVQKSPKLKKTQKVTVNNGKDEEESNGVPEGQSSSSCSSEDDIATNELMASPPSTTTVSGKTRASRGSATDPQSLYARKRRERINERLKILQNLVPNGTKVDISTMLEEAVEYVKFLQLQIKLLSSDDMWMYAPIAYNGMDIGLNGRMPPTSLSS